MDLDHKIFGGVAAVIMIIVIMWSASILIIQNNDPSRFDFLTEDQIESIKQLESLCSSYSATSKISCMNRIDAEISQYQINGVSKKAIQLDDVTLCHLISSDVNCLFEIAQKSDNKDACYEIINSHKKFESSKEANMKYLKGLQDYCLSRYTSS